MVRHNGILVNGKRINIPSYQVRPGDVVEVAPKAKEQLRILKTGFRKGDNAPLALVTLMDRVEQTAEETPEEKEKEAGREKSG